MSRFRFIVLIATGGPAPLLGKTLESIASARFPASIEQVIVAENGTRGAAESLLGSFANRLPVSLRYSPKPSKSRALNLCLSDLDDDVFVIFFDDDVRLHPNCLQAYVDAVEEIPRPFYAGGRCRVDYEVEPPDWMRRYLPHSAKGWSLGEKRSAFFRPEALGFNFGAFAGDVKNAGGFDESHGPGTKHPLGDETDLQKRLLSAGIGGYYLPEATVWHNVPRDRCSQPWALKRARQTGYLKGIWLLQEKPDERPLFVEHYRKRLRWRSLLKTVIPAPVLPQRSFRSRYYVELYRGYLEALEEERPAGAGRLAVPRYG